MYSTCLFCNQALGANEVIEAFPVGRRLAFDQGRGRLWVVCRRCEKWNLTPLEDRWEAIETCERMFRETRKRISTDNIGLARLSDGLELVRIGDPQRPEFAAWRYGDQFGGRRRKSVLIAAATTSMFVGIGLMGVAGVAAGGVAAVLGTAANVAIGWGDLAVKTLRRRRAVARIYVGGGDRLTFRMGDYLRIAEGRRNADGWSLDLHYRGGRAILESDLAMRAMTAVLPRINIAGGTRTDVEAAVRRIEEIGGAQPLLKWVADHPKDQEPLAWRRWPKTPPVGLHHLPPATRLALEMCVNEESEHRALEGELALLELAWKDAEEIAAIADGLTLPEGVETGLSSLKSRLQEH